MKKLIIISMFGAAGFLAACNKDAILNPNAPTMDQIIKNPSVSELNNLVTGTESGMRIDQDLYIETVSVIGREMIRISSSDARWVQEVIGTGSTTLDNTAFYSNRPWVFRYNTVRNALLLIEGTKNSEYLSTDEERNGYYGFAKTIMAYQMLLNLTLTWENGIRTDVKDIKNLGPIVSKDQALTDIAALLDEANTHLNNAEFRFQLSDGFTGLKDVAGFKKFNRAIAARVAAYRSKWAEVQTALAASFLNLTADPDKGAFHIFSTTPGDQKNILFNPKNENGEIRLAHPKWITDMENGDDRIAKVSERNTPYSKDGLTSAYEFWMYHTNVDPVAIIRNEELVLLYAESKAQLNELPAAKDAIDQIRAWHNLPPYAGAVTQAALITEMLNQRRYSLFGEGHRWVDVRRYGRLAELPKDRPTDDVWPQLPLPLSETSGQ